MIKHRLLLVVLTAVIAISLAVSCAPAGEGTTPGGEDTPSKAQYEWRLADFYTTGSTAGLVSERFCDIVNGLSRGRIHVAYYGSGVLGSYEETMDACSRGELEFAMISPYSSYHELQDLKGIPFAGTTFERVDQLFFGDGIIRQIINYSWTQIGAQHMFPIDGAFYSWVHSKRALVSPSDFGTDKYRVPPAEIYTKAFERIAPNAVGQVIPWGEYYSALERGVVDGGPAFMNTYESMKFYEVAPYYTDVNQNFNFDEVVMNKKLYDSLPTDVRAIVDEAARVADHYGRSSSRTDYALSELRCIDGGAVFTHLTDAQRQEFINLVKPQELWEQSYRPLLEKYYPGQNMYDKLVSEIARVEGQ